MTAKILPGCIGCGLCTELCSEVFRLSDEGTAEVYNQPDDELKADAENAAESCPVSVIELEN